MSDIHQAFATSPNVPPPTHTAMVRRKIRRELSPDAFKPCPMRALTALAIMAAIASVSIILVAMPLPRCAAILLSVLSGCMYASLFFLGHETGHGAVIRARRAQDMLLWAAFLIFLVSPTP